PRPILLPRCPCRAPPGARAAGLIHWVAWQENQQLRLLEHNEGKMAKVQEPPTPAPPVARQAPASSSSDQLADLSKTPAAIGGTASAKIPREFERLKQKRKFDSSARVTTANPPAGKESALRKAGARYSSDGLVRDAYQLDIG